MKKISKKLISFMLAAVMCISLLSPMTVKAAQEGSSTETYTSEENSGEIYTNEENSAAGTADDATVNAQEESKITVENDMTDNVASAASNEQEEGASDAEESIANEQEEGTANREEGVANAQEEGTVEADIKNLVVGQAVTGNNFTWDKEVSSDAEGATKDTWVLTLQDGDYKGITIDRNNEDVIIKIKTDGRSSLLKDESTGDDYSANGALNFKDTGSEYQRPMNLVFSGSGYLSVYGSLTIGGCDGDKWTIDEGVCVQVYAQEESIAQIGASGGVNGTIIVNGSLNAYAEKNKITPAVRAGNIIIGASGTLYTSGGKNGVALNGTDTIYREGVTYSWEKALSIADGGSLKCEDAVSEAIVVYANGALEQFLGQEQNERLYEKAFDLPDGYLGSEAEVKFAGDEQSYSKCITIARREGKFFIASDGSIICEFPVNILPYDTGELKYTRYEVNLTSALEGEQGGTSVALLEGGGTYSAKTIHTVKAQAKEGYTFLGWFDKSEYDYYYQYLDENGEHYYGYKLLPVSKNFEYTFTVNRNRSLIAVYKPNAKASLTVSGTHFRVNGGAEQMQGLYKKSFPIGTKITLTSTNDKFAYWMNESNKIVSKSKEYEFTLVGDTSFTPVYNNTVEKTAFVEFVSFYGQVMQAASYRATDTINLPIATSKLGGLFTGWNKTVEEIKQEIENGVSYIRVEPKEYSQVEAAYNVAVHYDNNTTLDEVYEGKLIGSTMTVEAKEIEGKTFSHWASDVNGENILGTDKKYFFAITSNMELYAIYVQNTQEVEKKPVINITDVYRTVENLSDTSTISKVVFVANRDVPEGYTVLETGMIYGVDGAFAAQNANEVMVIGADSVKQMKSSSTAAKGVYAMFIRIGSAKNTVIYARGYVIVKNNANENIETIYTDIKSGSYNNLADKVQ